MRSLIRAIHLLASLLSIVSSVSSAPASVLKTRQDVREVTTPAVFKSYTTEFTIEINGGDAANAFLVEISNNVGFITTGERRTSVLVTKSFEVNGETLYTVFGVDHLGPVVHVCYCREGQLVQLWLESPISQPGFATSAISGTCSRSEEIVTGTTDISATTFAVATPAQMPTITGESLTVNPDGLGIIKLPENDNAMDLLVYAYLDCVSCARAGTPNDYQELHVLLRNAVDACTAIIYLWHDSAKPIQLAWMHCLQDSHADVAIPFEVSWTAP